MPIDNHEHDMIMGHLIDIKESQATLKAKSEATYVIVEKLEKRVGKQNGRIGKLENWRSYLVGIWVAISAIGGIVWKIWF